jgi:hypothetical protein
MKAEDVTATLDMALEASGVDQARVLHRPRLLSDGSSYISDDLATRYGPRPWGTIPPDDPRQD